MAMMLRGCASVLVAHVVPFVNGGLLVFLAVGKVTVVREVLDDFHGLVGARRQADNDQDHHQPTQKPGEPRGGPQDLEWCSKGSMSHPQADKHESVSWQPEETPTARLPSTAPRTCARTTRVASRLDQVRFTQHHEVLTGVRGR